MTTHTLDYWTQQAAALKAEGRAYIDGEYSDALSGETFESRSPIDNRLLANVAACNAADADRAVVSARRAFDGGEWSQLPPAKRKSVLLRFAGLIKQHGDELALLDTLDMGKPIGDSTGVDIPATVRSIQWSAEAIDKLYDEIAPTAHDELGLVTREPVGVVTAIVPWNFPMIMASWKIGPALAMGNSVILKPSEKSNASGVKPAASHQTWFSPMHPI